MLSYVYFGTNDLAKTIALYNATLAPVQVRAELAARRRLRSKGGDPHEPGHRLERTGVSYSLVC